MTLDQETSRFRSRLDKGTVCGCCGRFGKRYKRALNSGMAAMLVRIYAHSRKLAPETGGWIHVSKELVDELGAGQFSNPIGREYSKLKHWGLLEQKDPPKGKGKGDGLWRITLAGQDFVEGKASVPRHIYLYDGRLDGFSDEVTTIRSALDDRFSYAALMA